ncbi:hypothetical protein RSOLAG1IB_12295 [Rhizoctonia solani AG-1 IB]|uniref:Uncharacterized protein n=1 Tax=Thanatephorus cucumeris (strain AG1-IB / isolate 7/3/14) TaxID=1108050 RepID=A0A0B7FQU2_THACB|nr:hypothetical protein RSOLAG1IB_12295 [Rhizoctonia solani AG-1 IB]
MGVTCRCTNVNFTMDGWISIAQTQAALRQGIIYSNETHRTHTHEIARRCRPPTPSLALAQPSVSHVARHAGSLSSRRAVPYSLTPIMASTPTRFTAATIEKLEKAISRGLAPRTHKNYSSFVNQFQLFCEGENIEKSAIFPADELVLCAFVGSFAGEKSGSTAGAAVSALKAWHRLHGVEWKGSYLLAHVLKGVANLAPQSSRRPARPPVTIPMLNALRLGLNLQSPFDSAVFAAALSAFWGQCRLGEILGSSRLRHDPSSIPSRSSFTRPAIAHEHAATSSASLRLPRTKTHQTSGELVYLTSQKDGLSPVSAIISHLHTNTKIPDSHHIFAYTTPENNIRCLTREDFLARCNEIWSLCGFSHVSGHSFRIGGTHAYLTAGVPIDVVKKMGRWSSDAYLRYWRSIGSIVDVHAKDIPRVANYTKAPSLIPGARRTPRCGRFSKD